MSKAMFILGLAVGFVLGARAGQERYEQIKQQATGVLNNPRVQRNVDAAKQTAKGAAGTATQKVRDRVPGSHANASAPASSTSS
jgi:hypothetical protein